jgi:hypothetical protein
MLFSPGWLASIAASSGPKSIEVCGGVVKYQTFTALQIIGPIFILHFSAVPLTRNQGGI